MKVRVRFFAGLRDVFDRNEAVLELEDGADLSRLVAALCDTEERRKELLDESGSLREDIVILKGGRNIAYAAGGGTELTDGDELVISPMIGGG